MLQFGKSFLLGIWALTQCFGIAVHGNFAPFAGISAGSTEVLAGQTVFFSSEGSVDPDEQPEPLSFRWSFGDGRISAEKNPSHSFTEPGAYIVSLEVSDGVDQSIASLTIVVLGVPTPISPTKSSTLCFNGDESALWVANPDSDTVSAFAVADGLLVKTHELPTGKSPRSVAFSDDRILVVCEQSGELWVYNALRYNFERRIRVGHLPFGVCVAPVSGKVLVSNQGEGTLHIFDRSLRLERVIGVCATPRAIAITSDGRRAFVTDFITTTASGHVTEIDLTTNSKTGDIQLDEDSGPDTPSSSRGFPNLLSAICIEPAGRAVWVGGYKSNSGRGIFRTGESLTPFNTVRGFFGRINIASRTEETARRIDPNNADSISSIAFSPNGRLAFVTHQGAETLSIYDIGTSELTRPGDGNSVPFVSRVDVGAAPQGVLVSKDGQFVYAANFLGRCVTVINVAAPADPRVVLTIATTHEPLPASVANGKRMFYSSKAPVHSKDNYISCASCHADGGGQDGQTWDFTHKGEGLRNTIDLRGKAGLAHGPVHWSGNFDEIQDFENDIVNAFGGTGLAGDGEPPNPPLGAKNAGRSQNLDDLAAYVASLTEAPQTPFRASDRTLLPAASRGKILFGRSDIGCVQCHVPPSFTDSSITANPDDFSFHDVGTLQASSGQRLGAALTGIDTPTLLGLWASKPYLHDGSAPTLRDIFTTRSLEDKHGRTSSLTPGEIDDLVAYLLSLDDPSSEDFVMDRDGDGISDSWEKLQALDPLDAKDRNDDPDADGVPNYDEFLAGTDPKDSSSVLNLNLRSSGVENELWFHTVRGKGYVLQTRENLPGTQWEALRTWDGDGTSKSLLLPRAAVQQFYRLTVSP